MRQLGQAEAGHERKQCAVRDGTGVINRVCLTAKCERHGLRLG